MARSPSAIRSAEPAVASLARLSLAVAGASFARGLLTRFGEYEDPTPRGDPSQRLAIHPAP